ARPTTSLLQCRPASKPTASKGLVGIALRAAALRAAATAARALGRLAALAARVSSITNARLSGQYAVRGHATDSTLSGLPPRMAGTPAGNDLLLSGLASLPRTKRWVGASRYASYARGMPALFESGSPGTRSVLT